MKISKKHPVRDAVLAPGGFMISNMSSRHGLMDAKRDVAGLRLFKKDRVSSRNGGVTVIIVKLSPSKRFLILFTIEYNPSWCLGPRYRPSRISHVCQSFPPPPPGRNPQTELFFLFYSPPYWKVNFNSWFVVITHRAHWDSLSWSGPSVSYATRFVNIVLDDLDFMNVSVPIKYQSDNPFPSSI